MFKLNEQALEMVSGGVEIFLDGKSVQHHGPRNPLVVGDTTRVVVRRGMLVLGLAFDSEQEKESFALYLSQKTGHPHSFSTRWAWSAGYTYSARQKMRYGLFCREYRDFLEGRIRNVAIVKN